MQRLACLICVLGLFIYCGPKQADVEKIIENGVEVVLNHLEPYTVNGEPSRLILEEELRIDFEDSRFTGLGLVQPEVVDADSEGNMYLIDKTRASDYFILKFDKEGNYLREIGRKGQGPGEIDNLMFMSVSNQDEILITDWNKKVLAYDTDGALLRESKYNPRWNTVISLENGNYLATGSSREKTPEGVGLRLALYDSNFDEITSISFFDYSHLRSGGKRPFKNPFFYWRIGRDSNSGSGTMIGGRSDFQFEVAECGF